MPLKGKSQELIQVGLPDGQGVIETQVALPSKETKPKAGRSRKLIHNQVLSTNAVQDKKLASVKATNGAQDKNVAKGKAKNVTQNQKLASGEAKSTAPEKKLVSGKAKEVKDSKDKKLGSCKVKGASTERYTELDGLQPDAATLLQDKVPISRGRASKIIEPGKTKRTTHVGKTLAKTGAVKAGETAEAVKAEAPTEAGKGEATAGAGEAEATCEAGKAETTTKDAHNDLCNLSKDKDLANGTRVKVLFHDADGSGNSWYRGTIMGQKTVRKYKIEYDDDDEVSSLDVEDEDYVVLDAKAEAAEDAANSGYVKYKKREPRTTAERADKQARLSQLLDKLPADKRKFAEEEGWCDAKIIAWLDRSVNPNAYYYRFLPEGEAPKTGPWTAEETATLKAVCLEKKVNVQGSRPEWGIISQHIPGRVGYACSAAYRKFVDSGEIQDPNYIFVDGKSKYVFGRSKSKEGGECKPKREQRSAADVVTSVVSAGAAPVRRSARLRSGTQARKRRKKRSDGEERIYADEVSTSEDDEWDVGMKHFTDSTTIDWVTSNTGNIPNPLPNYIDQITGDVVIQPCISAQGYVAGKRTWHAAMENRHGKCPFTNVKITHRGLTLLTIDNIDQYRDSIRNWEGAKEVALSPVPVDDPLEEIYKDRQPPVDGDMAE